MLIECFAKLWKTVDLGGNDSDEVYVSLGENNFQMLIRYRD